MATRGMKRGGSRGAASYGVGSYANAYANYGTPVAYPDYDYYGYGGVAPGKFGGGYPPVAAGFGGMNAGQQAVHHGTHTSSKDPNSVKARVFVGNLNTKGPVVRDQLERLYTKFGPLVGLSLHKGYAFVQFGSETHARSAVSFTDGMTLNGQFIDVNIADEPKDRDSTTGGAANGGGSQAKRSRFDAGLDAQEELIDYPGFSDSLVCGHCKGKFGSWTEFRDHRKQPCQKSDASQEMDSGEADKPEGEPDSLNCFICKTAFPNGWTLIEHLGAAHNMQVMEK